MSAKRAFFGTFWRGGPGAIGRCLHVASQLRADGFECAFFAEGPSARFVSDAGFRVVPPPPVAPPIVRDAPYVSRARVVGVGASFGSLSEFYALRGYGDASYVRRAFDARFEAIRDFDPDILFGYWSWETTVAARVLRRPLVNIIQRCLHPLGGGFAHQRAQASEAAVVGSFNELLVGRGLQPITAIEDLMVGDLTMVSGTSTTDPLPSNPTLCYTGPLLWFGSDGDDALPNDPGRKKAWIYASDDPSWVGGVFLVHVLAPVLRDADFAVVISSGGHPVPQLREPGITCTDYIPGDRAAAWADLIVGRGGHDLFWTAVLAGKPFFGVPPNTEWLDYCLTARNLGVGDYCSAADSDGERLRHQIDRLVGSSDVDQRLHALRDEALTLLRSIRPADVLRARYPALWAVP